LIDINKLIFVYMTNKIVLWFYFLCIRRWNKFSKTKKRKTKWLVVCSTHNSDRNQDLFKAILSTKQYFNSKNLKSTGVKREREKPLLNFSYYLIKIRRQMRINDIDNFVDEELNARLSIFDGIIDVFIEFVVW
jgi:hypothetical protein